MNIKSDNKNGISIVRVEGNIDISTSPDFKKHFKKIIGDKVGTVVINLEKVDYMDSSGLATLVEIYKNMRKYEGTIRLVELSDKVKGLFAITKLDKLFKIFDDEALALDN